jgi:hypothetical protein
MNNMEKSTPTQQTVAHGPNDEHLSMKHKKQSIMLSTVKAKEPCVGSN